MATKTTKGLTFQELIFTLQKFWAERGCILQQPYDVEVGAGTMSPETFLRVLGPKPYKVAYVQPSRRPADGRYGDNPNRLYKHTQLQVILKPPPNNVQELYLESLAAIGIDLRKHDLKFEEDNWESPTLGAWGIGWQVMLDGLEITQFTYFQQCGGVDLDPISAELTYGLERLCAFLQDVDSVYDIVWARDPQTGTETLYREVRYEEELQFSKYNFEAADIENLWKTFNALYEEASENLRLEFDYQTGKDFVKWTWKSFIYEIDGKVARIPAGSFEFKGLRSNSRYLFRALLNRKTHEARAFLSNDVPSGSDWLDLFGNELSAHTIPENSPVIEMGGTDYKAASIAIQYALTRPTLDLALKCSHLFNLLDARGAISVTERVAVIARIRKLAVGVAEAYVQQQSSSQEAKA